MSEVVKPRKKFALNLEDLGPPDSLRRNILQKVSSEQYQGAIESLKDYKQLHPQYPDFIVQAERYLDYSVDLVNGIKAKKSFPGISNLPMNKQEELFSRAYDHFEDLKITLRRVEKAERDVRLVDRRSTVWVLKAIMHSSGAIVLLGLILEIAHGTLGTAGVVIDDGLDKIISLIFGFIGMK